MTLSMGKRSVTHRNSIGRPCYDIIYKFLPSALCIHLLFYKRLVYWLPCDYMLEANELPQHPCLR